MRRTARALLGVALATAATGCQSFLVTVAAILAPDPTIEARYDLAGQRVVLLCTPAQQIQWSFPGHMERLAEQIWAELKGNVSRIDLVGLPEVRDLVDRHPDFDSLSRADIGRHFKADTVVEIEIYDYTLNKSGTDYVLRGHSRGSIRVADVHQKGKVVWEGKIDYTFPKTRGYLASDFDLRRFGFVFAKRLGTHVARHFYDYTIPDIEES